MDLNNLGIIKKARKSSSLELTILIGVAFILSFVPFIRIPFSWDLIAVFLAVLVAVSTILYGRDVITWSILLVLFGLFVSIVKLHETSFVKLSLKFIGVYVLLDAIRAPLQLIDGRHYGDGAKLSDLTMIPEVFWVVLWMVTGIYGVWYLWKSSRKA